MVKWLKENVRWPDGVERSCDLKDLEDFCVSDIHLEKNILFLKSIVCTT